MIKFIIAAIILVIIILIYVYWKEISIKLGINTAESFSAAEAVTKRENAEKIVDEKVVKILSFMRNAMKKSMDVKDAEKTALVDANAAVTASLNASETNVANLSSERDSLKAQIVSLTSSGTASDEELAQLNGELSAIESTINTLITSINKYKAVTKSMGCYGDS